MTKIDTTYLTKCNKALQRAYEELSKCDKDDFMYEMYRSATIKEFEILLEQSGKLLKKKLKPYFHTNKEVDKLVFKDIFRTAGLHSLLTLDEVERWLIYRDNRNSTAHDYGEYLANETLILIEQFIKDVDTLIGVLNDT
jgi:nucleotidyltransferase substrate binding protein (TIGR01987 family)